MDEPTLRVMAEAWAEHDWREYAFRGPADLATGYFDFAVLVLGVTGVTITGQRHPDDDMNKLGNRSVQRPCDTCPFVGMSEDCKRSAVEPGQPVNMLCHESQSLDGERPDRLCVGFHGEQKEERS